MKRCDLVLAAVVAAGAMIGCGKSEEGGATVEGVVNTTLPAVPTPPSTAPIAMEADDSDVHFVKLPTDAGTPSTQPGGKTMVTASGLMYEDLKPGTGETPKVGQTVAVRLTGRHAKNGEMIESNEDDPRTKPREFVLGHKTGAMPGLQQGVATMKQGGRRKLTIPPGLAYGSMGALPAIEPNETLVYEVELVEIKGEPHEWGKKSALATTTIGPPATVASTEPATQTQPGARADGLVIEDAREGTGAVAVAGKKVRVHYVGTLTNGMKFDSSRDRGNPFAFTLGAGEVIRGWDEGVAGMKVGGVRNLTIPPKLGYGSRPAGKIPPNATLKFEVELLGVE